MAGRGILDIEVEAFYDNGVAMVRYPDGSAYRLSDVMRSAYPDMEFDDATGAVMAARPPRGDDFTPSTPRKEYSFGDTGNRSLWQAVDDVAAIAGAGGETTRSMLPENWQQTFPDALLAAGDYGLAGLTGLLGGAEAAAGYAGDVVEGAQGLLGIDSRYRPGGSARGFQRALMGMLEGSGYAPEGRMLASLASLASLAEAGAPRAAVRSVVERLNQPGPVPTMYSNPVMAPFGMGRSIGDNGGLKLFRGDTGSAEHITGGIGEGLLFGTPYEDVARLYGDNISQFELQDGARVLTEGSKEFAQITGRKRGPLLRNLRPGENLTGAANDAIEKARAAGYDAVEFNSMRDMGVAVLNPSIVRSAPTDPAIAQAEEVLGPMPQTYSNPIPGLLDTTDGLNAYHATHAPFDVYDWSKLGSSTLENTSGTGVEDWATSLAKIGPWAHEKPLGDRIGMSYDLPVRLTGKGKHFQSLDALSEGVARAGGPDKFRENMTRKGFGHISVADEEFGGKSFIGLSPDTFTINGSR